MVSGPGLTGITSWLCSSFSGVLVASTVREMVSAANATEAESARTEAMNKSGRMRQRGILTPGWKRGNPYAAIIPNRGRAARDVGKNRQDGGWTGLLQCWPATVFHCRTRQRLTSPLVT